MNLDNLVVKGSKKWSGFVSEVNRGRIINGKVAGKEPKSLGWAGNEVLVA